jgi:hypothetical protein
VSDLDTAPAETQEVIANREQVVGEVTQPLVVITEQQVLLSTAAAVPLPSTKPRRGVIAALHAMFVRTSEEPVSDHITPRYYPPRRDAFVEDAAMAREMRRL